MNLNDSIKNSMILAVDDNPINLNVLAEQLSGYGFTILPVKSGEKALELMTRRQPDIILLDIMMPGGMDGYETCRQIKADERTKDIPVIFMSALSDTDDKVKGFELGAVDYISKPFKQEELLARINAHLIIRRQQEQLKRLNSILRRVNANKDRFFSIIAHDLKSPFSILIGMPEIILAGKDTMSKEAIVDLVTDILQSAENTFALLENLLNWSRIQCGIIEFLPAQFDIQPIVERTINLLGPNARHKQIELRSRVLSETLVTADANMVETVVRNLVSNALKFTNPNGVITVSAVESGSFIEIAVADTGVGIPEEDLRNLFWIEEKIQTKGTAGETGTGLGLVLCKEFVEKNGGAIWAESQVDQGTTFRFTLPKNPILPV